jgi:hypothetical protein
MERAWPAPKNESTDYESYLHFLSFSGVTQMLRY